MAQKSDEFPSQKKLLESEIETIRAADRDARRRISRKVVGTAGNTRRIEGAALDCGCATKKQIKEFKIQVPNCWGI
jgi:hypothetical protein